MDGAQILIAGIGGLGGAWARDARRRYLRYVGRD